MATIEELIKLIKTKYGHTPITLVNNNIQDILDILCDISIFFINCDDHIFDPSESELLEDSFVEEVEIYTKLKSIANKIRKLNK
jgi:hypothetical protein